MNPRVYGSDKHLMTMFSIALQIRAKNILELGTCSGRTAEPFLLAAQVNEGKFTTIDIGAIREGWTCPEHLKSYFEFVQIDAIEYLEQCVSENKKFDLVYVDDFHSYPHVKRELELIDRLVTPSSIVLLHDLMYDVSEPDYNSRGENGEFAEGGPYRAVSELDSSVWEWSTLPVDNGLTILRKKTGVIRR